MAARPPSSWLTAVRLYSHHDHLWLSEIGARALSVRGLPESYQRCQIADSERSAARTVKHVAARSSGFRARLISCEFSGSQVSRVRGTRGLTGCEPGAEGVARVLRVQLGCLQASPHVRVVQLEYSDEKSKGRIVDSAVLTKLFKAPLMRSANVITA